MKTLLEPGLKIKKGDLLAEIERDNKTLQVYAPISGTVERTNISLKNSPELMNEEPYNSGWMYEVKPSKWKTETKSFYFADEATEWIKNELNRFKDFLAASLNKHASDSTNIVYQDGGELTDHTLSRMSKEVWSDFQKEFLN